MCVSISRRLYQLIGGQLGRWPTNKTCSIARFILIGTLSLYAHNTHAEILIGRAQAVDGDTLIINERKIRLDGIDAPETDQFCLDAFDQLYACGLLARDQLNKRIGVAIIVCESEGKDRYGRFLSTCYRGQENLNDWLVKQGLALAYVRYSNRYKAAEDKARIEQRGIWNGAFIAPWDWRGRRFEKTLLGTHATKAPVSMLSSIGFQSQMNRDCLIKGSIDRQGNRIYFVPTHKAYGKVHMGKGIGKRWFCSEEEAEAAGWRRAPA